MWHDDVKKALNRLDILHHYISSVFGKEEAKRVMVIYDEIDAADKHVMAEAYEGNDVDLPEEIKLLVESINGLEFREEVDPYVLRDWQVLAEAN